MLRAGDEIENARTGQRMKFVVTAEDSGGELLRLEAHSPPGPFEPVHVHPEQVSTAEVLSGSLLFMVKGREVRVNAGERLEIPAHTPHTFRNDGKDVVEWIGEFRPALRSAEFFETFFVLSQRGELDEGGMPSLLQIAVSAPVFAREIRLASPPWAIQRLALAPLAPLARLRGLRPTYAWSSLPAIVPEARVSRSSV
jgi:mannose-6-phosphate isomerase-like protein (cupin superfamily)